MNAEQNEDTKTKILLNIVKGLKAIFEEMHGISKIHAESANNLSVHAKIIESQLKDIESRLLVIDSSVLELSETVKAIQGNEAATQANIIRILDAVQQQTGKEGSI